MKKISMVVVQARVDTFNDIGGLIGEQMTNPVQVFRGKSPDVFAELDRLVEEADRQAGSAGAGSVAL